MGHGIGRNEKGRSYLALEDGQSRLRLLEVWLPRHGTNRHRTPLYLPISRRCLSMEALQGRDVPPARSVTADNGGRTERGRRRPLMRTVSYGRAHIRRPPGACSSGPNMTSMRCTGFR